MERCPFELPTRCRAVRHQQYGKKREDILGLAKPQNSHKLASGLTRVLRTLREVDSDISDEKCRVWGLRAILGGVLQRPPPKNGYPDTNGIRAAP